MQELNFTLMLSLKEISLRRVAVNLWSQTDILSSIHEFVIKDRIRFRAEFKVQDKMKELQFPPLVIEQLKNIIKPIGSEIRTWKRFHEEHLIISKENFDIRILEQLCWTYLGTIDYRKTAESLIRREILGVVEGYKLACLYCLENYIPVHWEQLPEKSKKYFYKENKYIKPELEHCWPYILKGEGAKLDYLTAKLFFSPTTFNLNAFEYSAINGNKTATEYFFRKLTCDERNESLIGTTHVVVNSRRDEILSPSDNSYRGKLSDTFYYLLGQMSHEQQMELLKNNTCNVLMCLLDWPWQDLFLRAAEQIWNFLPESNYGRLVRNIIGSIKFSDYYFPQLFREFLQSSPIEFKKRFVHHEMYGIFLRILFEIQDSETIEVIFRDLDYIDRKRLVTCENVFEVFYDSITANRYRNMVALCIREAMLSEEDIKEMQETFLVFANHNSRRRLTHWTIEGGFDNSVG